MKTVQAVDFAANLLLYSSHMPEGERNSQSPSWHEQERGLDLAWINENLHVFWPLAQLSYVEVGRGAIVTDLTVDQPGGGHPFAYCNQAAIITIGDPDALRIVAQYDPDWQFVALLIKPERRISTYRIGVHTRPDD